ncbi:hypothetical protein SNE40_016017 [Patella caerulea]|uniref:Ig-like domain-containing protein n=1 Tax=Patella caerulea TaxID=87958 RepID=A0AAN8J823_PATCE
MGDVLNLQCQTPYSIPPPLVQICLTTCYRTQTHDSTRTLNLYNAHVNITADMNGSNVYCTATNSDQTIISNYRKIQLEEDIQDVFWNLSPVSILPDNTLTLGEGDLLNLTCEALKAFPIPTIEINIQSTNYNQSIVSTGRMLRSNVNATHEMNGAIISCSASIPTKRVEANYKIQLQVLYAPIVSISVPNVATNNSTGININNSTAIILQCTADAQPSNLTFSPWQHYIGNELIREVQGIEGGDGKSYSLEVSTDLKDAGLYICTVSNGINRNNQTQQTASYRLNTVKAEFHINNITKEGGRIGDYIELYKIYTCPMDCNITWYKDGTRDITSVIEYSRIPSYYNSTILIPSNKTVIKLTSIQLSDTATYTCNICNINGCINSSVELTVEATSILESLEGSDKQLVFGITGGAIFAIVILLIIIVILAVILRRNKPVKKNPTKPEMEIMENALYQSADLDPTFTGTTSTNNENRLVYAQVQKDSSKKVATKPEMEIMENAMYQSADLDPAFTGNNTSNNNSSELVYSQVQKNSKKKDNNQKPESVYYNTTCDEVLYSNTGASE